MIFHLRRKFFLNKKHDIETKKGIFWNQNVQINPKTKENIIISHLYYLSNLIFNCHRINNKKLNGTRFINY